MQMNLPDLRRKIISYTKSVCWKNKQNKYRFLRKSCTRRRKKNADISDVTNNITKS